MHQLHTYKDQSHLNASAFWKALSLVIEDFCSQLKFFLKDLKLTKNQISIIMIVKVNHSLVQLPPTKS